MTPKQQSFIDAMSNYGLLPNRYYSRSELNMVAETIGMKYAPAWIVQDSSRRQGRGVFDVPEFQGDAVSQDDVQADSTTATPVAASIAKQEVSAIMGLTGGERMSLVPNIMSDYVPWGHHKNITTIIGSRQFAPLFITGLSGNGKTTMIEQACAKSNRDCYRVNITQETDEDDLIGGFRLIKGETAFVYGPVVEAMNRGGVLLLDEIDLASSKIMCLQPVLEGKGVFIKKTGEWITPAKGFTVVATANTKGKGDTDGRFIGTNVMNEAFLDRFDWTMERSTQRERPRERSSSRRWRNSGKSISNSQTTSPDGQRSLERRMPRVQSTRSSRPVVWKTSVKHSRSSMIARLPWILLLLDSTKILKKHSATSTRRWMTPSVRRCMWKLSMLPEVTPTSLPTPKPSPTLLSMREDR